MRPLAVLVILAAACATKTRGPEPGVVTPPSRIQAAPAQPVDPVAARRKALVALLDEQWEYNLRTHPELASMIGDHRYDDRWTDHSPAAIAADLEKSRSFLERFAALDTTGLSEQEVLDQQLMVHNLKEIVDNAKFEEW